MKQHHVLFELLFLIQPVFVVEILMFSIFNRKFISLSNTRKKQLRKERNCHVWLLKSQYFYNKGIVFCFVVFFSSGSSVSQDSFAFFLYSANKSQKTCSDVRPNSPDTYGVMGEIPVIFHFCRKADASL